MFLYPQSVEDANNSGMNLLDQSVIKKGMDYSNKLDKLLLCSDIFMIYFDFGAMNFSGSTMNSWLDQQIEGRDKTRERESFYPRLPRPCQGLITQTLSNGAPRAPAPPFPPPFPPKIVGGDPLAFNGEGVCSLWGSSAFPRRIKRGEERKEVPMERQPQFPSFPPSPRIPPFPGPIFYIFLHMRPWFSVTAESPHTVKANVILTNVCSLLYSCKQNN